jgi:uncharacterized damage-inducible protein DinB
MEPKMTEVEKIGDQLRRAFEGEAWFGDSLSEILAGVTAEKASAHPVPQVHSVVEIVLHLIFTEDVMRRRIEGERATIHEGEDLFSVGEVSEVVWKDTLVQMETSHRKLREVIGKLKEEDLEAKVVGQEYSIYFLLHGLIQHLIYHAGQIAMLKKAQV